MIVLSLRPSGLRGTRAGRPELARALSWGFLRGLLRGRGPLRAPLLLALLTGLVVAASAPVARGALGGFALLLVLLCVGWGRLVLRLFRVGAGSEVQLLLGVALVGHAIALPAMVAGVPILAPAALLPLGAIGLLRAPRSPEEEGAAWPLAAAAAAGFAGLWALDSAGRYAGFLAGGPMRLWLDVFTHAGTIAEFGDPRSAGASSGLARAPGILYHAVSHAFPGLAVRLTGVGPLDAIPGLWLPLGITLTAFGLLALGRALAGVAGGALALAFLALAPDAGAYGLANGFLSFHWMMETSPGGLYALPVGLAALALLVAWSREGGGARLALGLGLLLSVFLLRVHVLEWLLAPVAVLVLLRLPRPGPRARWALIALGAAAAPAALLLVAREEVGRVGLTTFLTQYLALLHQGSVPTGYDGLYARIVEALGPLGAVGPGLGLALLAMGGVWLPLYAALALLAARRGKLEALDAVPPVLLAWGAVLMVLAPTPFHGDVSDMRQRGFVVVVAVLLAWCARHALQLVPQGSRASRALPAALAALLALPLAALWMPSAKVPRMAWGAPYVALQPRPGLVAVARWIGREARPGESFALAGLAPDALVSDDATIVLGISGVPAYLSRPGMMRASGPPRSLIAAERAARLERVGRLSDPAAAMALLRAEGVGAYVAPHDAAPAWDPRGDGADFRGGEMLGWRVRP